MKKVLTQNEIDEIVEDVISGDCFEEGEFPNCCGIAALSCFSEEPLSAYYDDVSWRFERQIDEDDEKMPTKTQWLASMKRIISSEILEQLQPHRNVMISLLKDEQKEIISIIRSLKTKAKGVFTFKPMISTSTRNKLVFITFVGNDNIKELAKKKKKK